jgi:MoaA/NifB/PqqE/SkfB family radical SAM enzyme
MQSSEHMVPNSQVGHRQGMLWVEITNGCNLNCGHCYSDSFPGSGRRDTLDHANYLRVLEEAAEAGLSIVQFIGGEPFLYKRLPELVVRAQQLGFERVEIFSNLTVPRPDVLDVIDPLIATLATSIYSDSSVVHDRITRRLGSFVKTLSGIRTAVSKGILVRAGFIEMEQNEGHFDRTAARMYALGVSSVGHDRVREFGRAGGDGCAQLGELCGSCSGKTICVSHDGRVLPCIMSRSWPIGNIKESSLGDIMTSELARKVRLDILNATAEKRSVELATQPELLADCVPSACQPNQPDCSPRCQPGCYPGQGCIPCGPSGSQPCYPNQRCNPIGCGNRF